MAVAGSTLLKNQNMHMQQHHLSLSWSGKVQHRFVSEINITLVSFLHPIADNQRLPWIIEIKNNLSNSQSSLSGCIPVAMLCSDLENSYSCLNSTINNQLTNELKIFLMVPLRICFTLSKSNSASGGPSTATFIRFSKFCSDSLFLRSVLILFLTRKPPLT